MEERCPCCKQLIDIDKIIEWTGYWDALEQYILIERDNALWKIDSRPRMKNSDYYEGYVAALIMVGTQMGFIRYADNPDMVNKAKQIRERLLKEGDKE